MSSGGGGGQGETRCHRRWNRNCGFTVRTVDTDPKIETQLLRHAERQTKALENINWVVMALFVLGLIGVAIWVITSLG